MNTCVTVSGAIALVLSIALYQPALHLWEGLGIQRTVTPLHQEKCVHIKGADACETIAMYPPSHVAFMACGDAVRRRERWFPPTGNFKGKDDPAGHVDPLYLFDYKTDQLVTLQLAGLDGMLRTTGISVVNVDASTLIVMTINHRYDASVVEIFEHTLGTSVLNHVETVQHPLITTPNSIVALDRKSFYVTNDHYFPTGILRELENVIPLPLTNVAYRDSDGKVSIAADGLKNANGIAMTPDQVVYVSEGTGFGITLFERIKKSGKLRPIYHVPTGMMVDNLHADATSGAVYGAAFPKLLDVAQYLTNKDHVVPSVILKITNNTDNDLFFGVKYKATQEIRLTRQESSAVTTATSDESSRVVLLGSMMGQGFFKCTL